MIEIPAQHMRLFEALKNQGIEYRLVQGGALLTTLLIREAHRGKLPKAMKTLGGVPLLHPYSKWYGYSFLYQLKEFQLYAFGEALVEVFFALPCMSLTPKTWIPLDKQINDPIWTDGFSRDGVPCLNPETEFIYRLTRCVFDRGAFDDDSRDYLRQALPGLDEQSLHAKLQTVFFRFTDPLLAHIREDRFDSLASDYHRFTEY